MVTIIRYEPWVQVRNSCPHHLAVGGAWPQECRWGQLANYYPRATFQTFYLHQFGETDVFHGQWWNKFLKYNKKIWKPPIMESVWIPQTFCYETIILTRFLILQSLTFCSPYLISGGSGLFQYSHAGCCSHIPVTMILYLMTSTE